MTKPDPDIDWTEEFRETLQPGNQREVVDRLRFLKSVEHGRKVPCLTFRTILVPDGTLQAVRAAFEAFIESRKDRFPQ